VRAFSLLVIAILAWPGLSVGQAEGDEPGAWSAADNLSTTPGRSAYATLVENPVSGDLFVAWMDNGVAERPEVMGRRWERASQAWQPPLTEPAENLSRSEWHDSGPVFYFDEQGNGLFLWSRRYAQNQGAPTDGTDVLWRAWNGTAWSDEQVLMHDPSYLPSTYGFGLIPVELPEGMLLFITQDVNYRTTEYRNGAWSELSPWAFLDVSLAQVIRDSAGLFHAAAYGQNSSQDGWDRWFLDAYYLTFDGSNWSVPINLSDTDGVVRDVGLAFDRQGRLHFLWSDPDSPYSSESKKSALWERVYTAGDWTPNTEVLAYQDKQAINGFALAVDRDGTLHLVWSQGVFKDNLHTELGIYYRSGDGDLWGPETTVYTSTAESRYPVLSAGDHGAALVWQEGSISTRQVYFAQQTSSLLPRQQTYLPMIWTR